MKYLITLFLFTYSSALAGDTIIAGKITSDHQEDIAMVTAGVALANKVDSSQCFINQVLNSVYSENQSYTQKQISDMMQTTVVTVNIVMYDGSWIDNRWNHTIGYEDENIPNTVFSNRYFVNTVAMVADNITHEVKGHSLGFRHDYYKPTSVPYGANIAFEECNK